MADIIAAARTLAAVDGVDLLATSIAIGLLVVALRLWGLT